MRRMILLAALASRSCPGMLLGVGQVMTSRVPADLLRDVNRIIEGTAWGGYRTEFYPTHDYRALREGAKRRAHP